MTLSTRRARLLACAALAAPALLLCGPAVFAGRQLQGGDFQSGYGPLYEFARRSWQETRELPRWSPHHYAGIPFWGNPQTDLLYPPNWVFLVAPSGTAYGWLAFAHLLAAAAGMYRLVRGLGFGRPASVLSGVSYALSFTLVGRLFAGHYPYFVSLCLAPFLLHAVRRAVHRPAPRSVAGLAAASAALLLGGSPQFILQIALLAGAFAAWRLAVRARSGAGWKRPAVALAIAGAIGVLISLAHLLPAMEMAGDSSRASGDLRGLTEPYGDFTPSSLIGLFVPRFHWHAESDLWLWHEKALYAGLLPLLLAASALGLARNGLVRFFAGAALLAGLAAAGEALPVHRLLSLLPTYARYRVPERILWVAVFSISVLAAAGWEALSRATPAQRRRMLAISGLVGGLLAAALLFGQRAPREAGLFVLTSAAALGAAAAASRGARGLGLALAVTLLDAGGQGIATLRYRPGNETALESWVERSIGADRSRYRLMDLTGTDGASAPRGFRLIRSGGYPIPSRLAEFFARAWRDPQPSLETLPTGTTLRDVSILRRLNIRWIVSSGPPLHPEWRRVGGQGSDVLYEDPGALPEASLAGEAAGVSVARPSPHRITLAADARRSGVLVLREAWSPGWRATLHGADLPLRPTEEGLMEVDLPAGRSTVEFVYAPRTWRAGWSLTLLGLAALLGCLALSFRRLRIGRALDNRSDGS